MPGTRAWTVRAPGLARFKAKHKFWLERTELENIVPGDPSYGGVSVAPV